MPVTANQSTGPDLELYVFDFCPYCQRALITLQYAGLPHRLVILDPDRLPDSFREVSPLGNVPVLRVNSQETLFESTVINDYLAALCSSPMLSPDPLERAKLRAWGEYASTCQGAFMQFLKADDAVKAQGAERALTQAFEPLIPVMDAVGPYFTGTDLAAIDTVYAPLFLRMAEVSRHSDFLDEAKLPDRLRRWQRALLEHPAVRASTIGEFPQVFRDFIRRKAAGSHIGALLD